MMRSCRRSKRSVKWIKHIDFEISSRKEDEDEELQRVERKTPWGAIIMARGERARARDKVMADALGPRDQADPYVGPSHAGNRDVDQGGGDGGGDAEDPHDTDLDPGSGDGGVDAEDPDDKDMDPGGGDGGVDAEDPHDKEMDPGGGDGGLDAEDPHDKDMNPGGGDGDEDMDPAGVEGGVQGDDASVKDCGPGSEAPHLSGRSMDVCGDCGLIPCMCGPTPQVIPVSAGETVAEAEAEVDAKAHAAFKAREELEQRPFFTVRCPTCRMKHLWRLGEEPWGTCSCGLAMTEMRRDDSASTGTSEVCVRLQCVVCGVSSAACGNTGVPGYKTRVHVYPVL